jgi:hypothetical protein
MEQYLVLFAFFYQIKPLEYVTMEDGSCADVEIGSFLSWCILALSHGLASGSQELNPIKIFRAMLKKRIKDNTRDSSKRPHNTS